MKKSNISKKTDCHPILADYGDDHFSIRINNKGKTFISSPWAHFPFDLLIHLNPNTKGLRKN